MKKNCWEHKNCGREPGGKNAGSLGVCPAATDRRLNGVHGGRNSGRACYMIAGTLCGGKIQGTYGQKYKNCEVCDFFRMIKEEEGPDYKLSVFLVQSLKEPPVMAGAK